ncbi:DNA damage-regulated autophagy modulator protein 1-like [Tropilaelaps mercedesae]|uniref:DNA damage-regulated autophagy modulator protein 1-like n=1 Tax=Tropilaelaps mercedesae TaxID=418985 RepID=A0A1V9XED6_9ACAR|nr:DNA damage-regulated autophagy modulator protein 1-like [Tropilaelaps mercedesae]
MAFGWAVVYLWLTLIASSRLRIARFIAACIATVSMFTTSITGAISFRQFRGTNMLHWPSTDPGYMMHVISVISEWTLAIIVNLFIASLACDIKADDERMPLLVNEANNTNRVNRGVLNTITAGPGPETIPGPRAIPVTNRADKKTEAPVNSVGGKPTKSLASQPGPIRGAGPQNSARYGRDPGAELPDVDEVQKGQENGAVNAQSRKLVNGDVALTVVTGEIADAREHAKHGNTEPET